MLFNPEDIRRKIVETARQCGSGKITKGEAGARLIEADPDDGAGYILLGDERLEAGDQEGAEACYWKALERKPCHFGPYFSLSDCRKKRDQGDPLAKSLLRSGLWKLGLCDEVPAEVSGRFRSLMEDSTMDFTDPATYQTLALALGSGEEDPEEVRDRLLPYEQLNRLQSEAAGGLPPELVSEMLASAERSIPIWRAALHEWANGPTTLEPDEAALLIALLGETADPEILDLLLDLVCFGERSIFLHANWAVWRVGQRFPAETLARFRAAAAAAPVMVRCALADQIALLPETSGMKEALLELLEGFSGFAREPDTAYLLVTVADALEGLGHTAQAERVLRERRGLLSKEGREWLREALADDEFVPKLVEDEIEGLTIEEICTDGILMEDEDEEDSNPYDGEDEEEEPELPLDSLPKPGRNDPCWCGSGKKYKKCHLAADEAEEREAARSEPEESLHARLHRELLDLSTEWHKPADHAEGCRLYLDRRHDEIPDSETELMGGFLEWYVYDFRPSSKGRTLVEEYLRRRGGRLSAAERELLESWREARFGIWEVQRVEEGEGVELKDLFGEDRFFVHDVSSSRAMVRWDCVLARIHRSEGRWYFAGNGTIVPRNVLDALRQQVEEGSRAAGQSASAFVRANSHRWHRMVHEVSRQWLDGLRVVNAEGDELEFCTAEYRVEDEAALAAALENAEEFEAEGRDEAGATSFGWLERGGGDPRRSYGHIEIRRGRLRLECNSRERLKNGRELLEKHGGAWLRHVGDSFRSIEEAKRAAAFGPRRGKSEEKQVPPEVEREIVLQAKAEHYATWPDTELPALGGMTPREAARSEAGRRALEDLLRTMENGEERIRRKGGPAYDFSALRKTLGM